MNKETSRKIVSETLQDSFDRDRFKYFLKNLLNKYEEAHFIYRGNTIPQAYQKHIMSLERLGKYVNGDHEIDLLIVNLQNQKALDRARTMQRNFVAWYLNGSRGGKMKDGALIAFVSPNHEDWRFSLVRMDYKFDNTSTGRIRVKEEFTPARRWSFLVGKNENSHTAQAKLAPIVEDDAHHPTLIQLEEAFNIEKVTREFFEKYRDLFLKVKEEIDTLVSNDTKVKEDLFSKSIETEDFAKKLLGQIVFLYFLQKKGWFGVRRDDNWGSGPKNFLRQLFEGKHGDYDNFFNDILEPLFYEALAVERDDDYYSRFKCKIPFLNGGLFDPIGNYDWVNTDIVITNELFSNFDRTKEGDLGTGILDIFDRYNFTVKEDEPLEREVAVDPEMLGKVFENLLEVKDRKSKGTFYTPREIVHYMCEQSLINYLVVELDEIVDEDDLETFIKFGDTVSENDNHVQESGVTDTYQLKLPSIKNNAEVIDKKLAEIKVCDPAIGSGAFPVGMMSVIVKARSVLSVYLKTGDRSLYDLKSECIQNSIYGVDIDPGAVEIAKLRLWLSLIVDEDDIKNIKPLPNLDYKIMQGNSLVEEFEGIRLFDNKLLSVSAEVDSQKIAELEDKEKLITRQLLDYYQKNPQWMGKKAFSKPTELVLLEKKIEEIRRALKYEKGQNVVLESKQFNLNFDKKITSEELWQELQRLHNEFIQIHDKKTKLSKQNSIEELNWNLIETTLREQSKESLISKVSEFKRKNYKPFFLWELHFSDVFAKNGGFDVVIANPPYLEARSPEFSDEMKKELQNAVANRWPKDHHLIPRGADLLIYFFELGIHLINNKGNVVFITQNSWLDTDYGKKFQSFLLRNTNARAILDSDYKYFDSKLGPNINTVITVFRGKTSSPENNIVFARLSEDYHYCPLKLSALKNLSCSYREIPYSDDMLNEYKWGILLSVDDVVIDLVKKLSDKGLRAGEVEGLSIGQGINVGKNSYCSIAKLKELGVTEQSTISVLSKEEGAPYVLSTTKTRLVNLDSITKDTAKALKKNDINPFNPKSTTKSRPILVLPRGISRHYCAFNNCDAYSDSGVDIYYDQDNTKIKLNLWLFLNSSIAWLIREISGRKNLGGGLLKAEATDLKSFPIYFEFDEENEIKEILSSVEDREALATIDELNTVEHKRIDNLVFNFLGIDEALQKKIIDELRNILTKRSDKSKT